MIQNPGAGRGESRGREGVEQPDQGQEKGDVGGAEDASLGAFVARALEAIRKANGPLELSEGVANETNVICFGQNEHVKQADHGGHHPVRCGAVVINQVGKYFSVR